MSARRRSRSPRALALPVAALAAAVAAGCTIPITAQTLTGGAINAGAMLFVDRYNDGYEGNGAYHYFVAAERDTLAALFEAAVAEANLAHMFPAAPREPAPAPPDAEPVEGEEGDGVVLARASRRGWRPEDPPAPETFSERQWTPAPLFTIRAQSPEARGDTLMWVVTHRASRQAAFLLISREGVPATRVALVPYDPPSDVFLSVPDDHAQRNAVEALHQVFWFAARDRLGPDVFGGDLAEVGR